MLLWIVVGVVVMLYGVVAYLAARTWQVSHVVLMVGVLLLTGAFLFLAAMTLKTQKEWRSLHGRLAQQLAGQESELERLTGVVSQEGLPLDESIPTLSRELGRALIHRGRVWRGTTPQNATENEIVISMQGWGDSACITAGQEPEESNGFDEPAEGENAEPVANPPHQIAKGVILFAFAEFPLDPKQAAILYGDAELPEKDTKKACRLPAFYLGRFEVTDTNENAIKVKSLYPFSETQQKVLQQRLTWALYETLPKDQRELFASLSDEQIQELFRKPENIDPADWAQAVREYARDGENADPGDLPERQEVKVSFTRETKIEVDAAGEVVAIDRPFDPTGRAVDASLQQGTPTEFQKGQVAAFPLPIAQQLVQNGSAELVDEPAMYRRPLRDFDLLLHDRQVALNSLQEEMKVVQGDQASLRVATDQARSQIEARQKEIVLLGEDLKKFQEELATMSGVLEELVAQRARQRKELSERYRTVIGLRDAMGSTRGGASNSSVASTPVVTLRD